MCQPIVQEMALDCEWVSSLPQSPARAADQSAVGELPVDAAGSWVAVRSRW